MVFVQQGQKYITQNNSEKVSQKIRKKSNENVKKSKKNSKFEPKFGEMNYNITKDQESVQLRSILELKVEA